MDNLTNKQLKDIIRDYKTDNCPAYSKLKKDGLIDIIKKLGLKITLTKIKEEPTKITKIKKSSADRAKDKKEIEKRVRADRTEHKREARAMIKGNESSGPITTKEEKIKEAEYAKQFEKEFKVKRKKSNISLAPKDEKVEDEKIEDEKVEDEKVKKNTDEKLKFLSDLWNDYSDFNSKRSRENFKKKYGDINLLNSIVNASKEMNFYPTPKNCYKSFRKILENSENALDGTAGLGFFGVEALEKNPKMKITFNELNNDLYKFLEMNYKDFPNVNVTNKDFLELPNKNDFDLIFLNPPFSDGGDKRFYLNFFFKACKMMKENTRYSTSFTQHAMIFICPPLKNNLKIGCFLSLRDILNMTSFKKFKDILKMLEPTKKYSDKQIKEIMKVEGKDYDYINYNYFPQMKKIGECNEFIGTKMSTDIYECNFTVRKDSPRRS